MLLLDDYNVNKFIYDGDELYGGLDHQKKIISSETDVARMLGKLQ